MPPLTDDATVFGSGVFVYCGQHLRPHKTGWCTVGNRHKRKLDATNIQDAYAECRSKDFPIYGETPNTKR